jgi:hypothetical protein
MSAVAKEFKPAVWNCGAAVSVTQSAPKPPLMLACSSITVVMRQLPMTPFGCPVVPDV